MVSGNLPKCEQCGKPLKPTFETKSERREVFGGYETREVKTGRILGYGYLAMGSFCTVRCGWKWALERVTRRRRVT